MSRRRFPLGRRIAHPRFVAAAFAGGALTMLFVWVIPAQRAITQRQAALEQAPAEAQTSGTTDALRQFYERFPALDAAPDEIRTLARLAAQHGIVLEQGDYRLVGESVGTLMRYEITLPVKSPYPQVRSFIAAALHELPNCALDAVTFDRRKAADALADAKIRFTLYVQGRMP